MMKEKALWDFCQMCRFYGNRCPGHMDDGGAYSCMAYRKKENSEEGAVE